MRGKTLAAFILAATALSACGQNYTGHPVTSTAAQAASYSSPSPKKRAPLDRNAQMASVDETQVASASTGLEVYRQKISCVPYARNVSGITLQGDAWRWWDAAKNVYDRGSAPQVGAVIVMKKTKSLSRGHVGVVTKLLNDREVLIDHANWKRNEVHRGALVRDVSKNNDWSVVEVWYPPIGDFGTSRYPVAGFIYPAKGTTQPEQVNSQQAGLDISAK